MKQKVRWAKTRSAAISLVVTLSLLLQILFIPYHQASGALAFVGSDAARVEALLKATFGGAAALCVQTDDDPSKAPLGCCDDDCPFCRFAAEAAILVIPDFPALPIRRNVAARIGLPPEPRGPPATPIRRQRARAPPDPV